MSVRRVMGIETEYGISIPNHATANPMVASGQVVLAYAGALGHRSRRAIWDYTGESPLSDARGFELSRTRAHPSQLTDEMADDPTMANIVLTNGARLYVDHAHPEYSAPEVTTPRDALTWDRAGELVMARAVDLLAEAAREGRGDPVNLYKNNTDGKGSSYGTHENYLLSRTTPFGDIVAGLTPFFVARQILCGAGRVGIGQHSGTPGFQLSSRADFIEAEVGLETTFRRPIINTRDEPHATPQRYRRLHVIIGDANLCEVAGLLKLGTTALVLAVIEEGAKVLGPGAGVAGGLAELGLAEPIQALRDISHDPTLTALVTLADGRRMTGLQLLWSFYERVQSFLAVRDGGEVDADTAEVMTRWEDVLRRLEIDVHSARSQLDWVAKLALLQGFRDRDDLPWTHPRLAAIDIQWSDVRTDKGLARTLEAGGRIERLTEPTAVADAVHNPPQDTRAYFRGECVRRYSDALAAASWDSVILEVPGESVLQRIATLEPLRGTRELVGDLLDRSPDAATLLRHLSGPDPGEAPSADRRPAR